MSITFYTTRAVLNILGVVDYGIVNVVGGVVSLFSFLGIALSTAASRFYNYDLGKNDLKRLGETFSLFLLIYVCLFCLLILLSETIGLWLVWNKLVIPPERIYAAVWFFHCSVLCFVFGILTVPYSALIVSHEDMGAYAWISIFQAVTKLIIVFLLTKSPFDKLLFYGALLGLVTLVHLVLCIVFCYLKYPESHYKFYFERSRFSELMQFSGWNMFGAMAWASSEMLVNILLNNYFGVAVNAARCVASQVSCGLGAFTQNFLTAARPQITKYWAVGEYQHFYVLIHRCAKAGFYLLFFLSLPILVETEFILTVWLKNVPENAMIFTKLVVTNTLITSLAFPVVYAAQATGRLALFEVAGSGVRFLVFPLSWIALRLGYPPQITMQIAIMITILCLGLRLLILRRIAKLPLLKFMSGVILPALMVAIVSSVPPLWVSVHMEMGLQRFIVVGFLCAVVTGISIVSIGLTSAERNAFSNIARSKLVALRKKCQI